MFGSEWELKLMLVSAGEQRIDVVEALVEIWYEADGVVVAVVVVECSRE